MNIYVCIYIYITVKKVHRDERVVVKTLRYLLAIKCEVRAAYWQAACALTHTHTSLCAHTTHTHTPLCTQHTHHCVHTLLTHTTVFTQYTHTPQVNI